MALIFEAQHEDQTDRCAVKVMLNPQKVEETEEVADRFQQEYNALADLTHPNVLQVLESGMYNNRPYFAMELLNGKILREAVQEWVDLPPTIRFAKAQKILIQITKALDYIHQMGWVHRDVTPANIMIMSGDRVKLMDFGVVKIPGTELTHVGEVIGTVAYISPEQIKGERVDSRADLYALGTSLYLMLTGKRPFVSRTLAGYISRHLNHAPTPPHHYAPMVPKILENACLRLLEKEPEKRFASANHLLHFLDAQESHDKVRLVGRTWELSQLRESIAHLATQVGGVLLLKSTAAGMGTTSLLLEAEKQAETAGIPCSFCTNQSPDQPAFNGIKNLLEDLQVTHSANNALLSFFGETENQFEKWTAFSAFRDILATSAPYLVIIDNLTQSDQGTIEVLEYLIRNLADKPILFILGMHSVDADGSLEGIISGRTTDVEPTEIMVGPIGVSAVEEWLLLWAKYSAAIQPLAARIQRDAEGTPMLINEMIRDLHKRNKILRDRREIIQMTLEQIETNPLALPHQLRTTTQETFLGLSRPCQIITLLIAIAHQPLTLKHFQESLRFLSLDFRVPSYEIQPTLRFLQSENFILEEHHEGTKGYILKHFWLRDLLIETQDTKTKQIYHAALGKMLEITHRHIIQAVVENLAYHFEYAGIHGKAYAYLFLAAKKLKKRSLVIESMQFLDRALTIEPMAREHMTLADAEYRLASLLLERSTVSNILGNRELAKEQANAADRHAIELNDATLLSRIAIEKARQAREGYDLLETEECLHRALDFANQAGIPKLRIVPLYESGALHWERGDLELARATFKAAQDASQELNDAEGQALSSNGLGVLSMCRGRSAEARWHFEQAIKVGKENGLVEQLVNSRTNLAELHHCMGNFRKGFQLVNEAITEAREVRHRHGLGVSLRYRAILLGDLGRYSEAEENARTAMNIQRELFSHQEELSSLIALIRSLLPTKQLAKTQTLIEHGLDLADNYDAEGYLPILLTWKAQLLLLEERPQEALEIMQEVSVEDGRSWFHQQARCYLNIARTLHLLGERERALQNAKKALDIADSSGYRFYAMRARQILSVISYTEEEKSRHLRIADSLSRSLAANLASQDADSFLARNTAPT